MPGDARNFFSEEQQAQILQAIRDAEQATSGEIRVHLERRCKTDVLIRAGQLFTQLGMQKTVARNGVLIYLATDDHLFAILGDAGIDAVVPSDFWDTISQDMGAAFREGRFTEGLCEGIRRAGEQLKQHFPFLTSDTNELTDEISFNS